MRSCDDDGGEGGKDMHSRIQVTGEQVEWRLSRLSVCPHARSSSQNAHAQDNTHIQLSNCFPICHSFISQTFHDAPSTKS